MCNQSSLFVPGIDFIKVNSWVRSHFMLYTGLLRSSNGALKFAIELKRSNFNLCENEPSYEICT